MGGRGGGVHLQEEVMAYLIALIVPIPIIHSRHQGKLIIHVDSLIADLDAFGSVLLAFALIGGLGLIEG